MYDTGGAGVLPASTEGISAQVPAARLPQVPDLW